LRAFVEQALYTSALYKCIKQALYLTYLNASAGIPAEITISVNGVTGLDKITIGVYNAGSGADPQSFFFDTWLDFTPNNEGVYSLDNFRFGPAAGYEKNLIGIGIEVYDGYDEIWISHYWSLPLPEVEPVDDMYLNDLHCEVPYEDVYIELYDERVNNGTTIVDSLTIHQVPEPATLLLLGLGGLMLRKKK
jgi:hypothetical protein